MPNTVKQTIMESDKLLRKHAASMENRAARLAQLAQAMELTLQAQEESVTRLENFMRDDIAQALYVIDKCNDALASNRKE